MGGATTTSGSSFSLSSSSCRQFSLHEIEEATNNFADRNILRQGGDSMVYLAEIYLNNKTGKTLAAAKLLNNNFATVESFENEIRILTKIQHPNIVSLLGYCMELGAKILIYEYIGNGCLSDHVYKSDGVCLSWKQRLNICLGAAYGLQHLHKETGEFRKGIVHGDVKPGNILLDENWVAKFCDFGLSHAPEINSSFVPLKGTSGFYAPEYVRSLHFTRKIDVYTFGVVMFEVLCGKHPWDREDESYSFDENEDLGVWAQENVDVKIKGEILHYSLLAFTDAIRKCLQSDPYKRATMDRVVVDLENAVKCQEGKMILNIGVKTSREMLAKRPLQTCYYGSRGGGS